MVLYAAIGTVGKHPHSTSVHTSARAWSVTEKTRGQRRRGKCRPVGFSSGVSRLERGCRARPDRPQLRARSNNGVWWRGFLTIRRARTQQQTMLLSRARTQQQTMLLSRGRTQRPEKRMQKATCNSEICPKVGISPIFRSEWTQVDPTDHHRGPSVRNANPANDHRERHHHNLTWVLM